MHIAGAVDRSAQEEEACDIERTVKIKWMAVFILCCILVIGILFRGRSGIQAAGNDLEETFYVEEDNGIAVFSFDNSAKLPVSSVRFDKFQSVDGDTNTPECPNLGVGIKYIQGDHANVDGEGKWRYVYCLEFAKKTPEGGMTMQYEGWANRKVSYALYYGTLYYGYPCRYEPYSTGNWQMDYFVTQMAVHVLNNEFTMDALEVGLNRSAATQEEKALVRDRITKMVNGANNSANYGGFTADGWMDMDTGTFSLEYEQASWTYGGAGYYVSDVFHPVFYSYYDYPFCEQIIDCEVEVPSGVTVNRKSEKTCSDFDLSIEKGQFEQWELTGTTIPVTVTVAIPRYWGGGIYRYQESSDIQDICFLTWDSSGGITEKSRTVQLEIPRKDIPLRTFTFIKKIKADEVVWEHGNPTFFFQLSGVDLDGNPHKYQCHVEFRENEAAVQSDGYLAGQAVIQNIPPGTYQAEELPFSLRYLLTGVESTDENVQVQVTPVDKVNGLTRMTANVQADLIQGDGSVTFTNRKALFDELSDNSIVVNHFTVTE